MVDEGRVIGDPTEVLIRSGGSSYVSLSDATTKTEPTTEQTSSLQLDATAPVEGPRPRRPYVGWLALVVAAVAAVLTGAGVGAAAGGEFVTATSLAWAAIVVSGIAVVGGVVAVIAGFGRIPGVGAVLLGLLANPFLLTQVLGGLQHLTAAAVV